jgi:hypothetical protein
MQNVQDNLILQIYYDDNSKKHLDRGFIPYDNSQKLTDLYENQVIIELYYNITNSNKKYNYVGVLSWRFFEKTRLRSEEVYRFIDKCDKDVILLTPKNLMNYSHPFSKNGFLSSQDICKLIDEENIFSVKLDGFNDKKCVSFCNYVLYKQEIFIEYVEKYLLKVYNLLNKDKFKKILNAKIEHRNSLYPVLPFFFESLPQFFIINENKSFDYIFKESNKEYEQFILNCYPKLI